MNVKVVAKDFYCRYCDIYDNCPSHHRKGINFMLLFTPPFVKEEVNVIIGEGDSENIPFSINLGKELRKGMSGCMTYEKGHMTCGGWYSLNIPLILKDNIIVQECNLTRRERVKLSELLNKYGRDILIKLYKENLLNEEEEFPIILEKYRPLLEVWKKEKDIVYDNIIFSWKPNSFRMVIYIKEKRVCEIKKCIPIPDHNHRIFSLGKDMKLFLPNNSQIILKNFSGIEGYIITQNRDIKYIDFRNVYDLNKEYNSFWDNYILDELLIVPKDLGAHRYLYDIDEENYKLIEGERLDHGIYKDPVIYSSRVGEIWKAPGTTKYYIYKIGRTLKEE